MTARSPIVTLNNGVELPALGLGVLQSPPEQTTAAVEAAIAASYPMIDTAAAYLNEREEEGSHADAHTGPQRPRSLGPRPRLYGIELRLQPGH